MLELVFQNIDMSKLKDVKRKRDGGNIDREVGQSEREKESVISDGIHIASHPCGDDLENRRCERVDQQHKKGPVTAQRNHLLIEKPDENQ